MDATGRIKEDIDQGNLGKARDRLHGLIHARPNELELRTRLGEVYWKLQYPEMAGRYWYLVENRTSEMDQAVAVFERSVGRDAVAILLAIKFRGKVDDLPAHPRRVILDLQSTADRRRGEHPRYSKSGKAEWMPTTKTKLQSQIMPPCCIITGIFLFLLAITGVVAVFDWFR